MVSVKILPEEDVIDRGFLDLIGREFATHEKGLAEWLKNAVDASLAAGFRPGIEPIVLRFTDGEASGAAMFDCIYFVGMTRNNIEQGFKPWGKLSGFGERAGHYGGYGIGGKFYMRHMFESSHLVTYCRGLVNVFGFDAAHCYGYGQGYRDRAMDPAEALRFADVDHVARVVGMADRVGSGERGFSVFRGIGPKGVGTRIDVEGVCRRLRDHPQAQRALKSCRVWVTHNGAVVTKRLKPRVIPTKPGFHKPWVRPIPAAFADPSGSERGFVRLSEEEATIGVLQLFVSSESLVQQGKMASLNRIDFLGKDGIAASYRIDELNPDLPHGDSIFGECDLSALEGFDTCYAKKTRDKLVDTPATRELLQWVGAQVRFFSKLIDKSLSERRDEGDSDGERPVEKTV